MRDVDEPRAAPLLDWFASRARALPWRTEPREPYLVLVSELMLQQTQVDRVVPRFEAFVRRFPTVEALAAASPDQVLEAWSGLGYYRRARQLHEAARAVAARGGGVPETTARLRELPGVGEYTAAAVASLAFGLAEPVVDGNVLRVASRVAGRAVPGDAAARAAAREWVSGLMEPGVPPGPLNEALMELGATTCLPRAPRCASCPLSTGCRARELGLERAIPRPKRSRPPESLEWVALCCEHGPTGRWLLRRVEGGPVLRGLWLPPFAPSPGGEDPVVLARACLDGLSARGARPLPAVRHSITFRRIAVRPLWLPTTGTSFEPPGTRWADPAAPDLPTSTLLAKLHRAVEAARREGQTDA